jgi:hypothetical protein
LKGFLAADLVREFDPSVSPLVASFAGGGS